MKEEKNALRLVMPIGVSRVDRKLVSNYYQRRGFAVISETRIIGEVLDKLPCSCRSLQRKRVRREAFAEIVAQTVLHLQNGFSVVINAPRMSEHERKYLLSVAERFGCIRHCIALLDSKCEIWEKERHLVIPDYDEGWDRLELVSEPVLDYLYPQSKENFAKDYAACLGAAYYHGMALLSDKVSADAFFARELYGDEELGSYLFLTDLFSCGECYRGHYCDSITRAHIINCHLRRTPREKREEI